MTYGSEDAENYDTVSQLHHGGQVRADICSYNLPKFGASVMMDGLRTHPVVIIGGLVRENPFFVPPDQLLLEIQERRERRPAGNRAATEAE